MTLRNAFEQNGVVAAAILLFGFWLVLTIGNVVASMGSITYGDWVGQTGVVGLLGLVVLAGIAGLLVFLYSELSKTDPAPDEFPPQ